jgi:hypothetical protein
MLTAADLIFGVTMQEPGVSKLVSVRLAQEEPNHSRTRERVQERKLAMA